MSNLTVLAIILGTCLGMGISYRYFKRKEKKLIKQMEKEIEDKNSHYNHTLESEGTDQPNKVEEIQKDYKEDSIVNPASTPKNKEKTDKEVKKDESE